MKKKKKLKFIFYCSIFIFSFLLTNIFAEETTQIDTRKLQNGSFEQGQTFTNAYSQPNQNNVPYWNTTAFQGKIELFRENKGTYISNVSLKPTDGTYAAELNADEESTLYQVVSTTPSSIYEWGLDHGARNGTDIMALVIGPSQDNVPSKPSKEGRDQFMQMIDWYMNSGYLVLNKNDTGIVKQFTIFSKKFGTKGTFQDNTGNNAFSLTYSTLYTEEWKIWIFSDHKAAPGVSVNPWSHYGSNASSNTSTNGSVTLNKDYLYTVPAGQTQTLFGFVSVGYFDSLASADKAKTYGNFLDDINFNIYHNLSGSTTTHGSAEVDKISGSNIDETYEVKVDDKLVTYIGDGQNLILKAVIEEKDYNDGCIFVGAYYTTTLPDGSTSTQFLNVEMWTKPPDSQTSGDREYTYTLSNVTSSVDVHFIFIKSPTVTYDSNGGKEYKVERQYNDNEPENTYSFKPDAADIENIHFISPYTSHAALPPDSAQAGTWKFMGWLLTGDPGSSDTENQINPGYLHNYILPAVHTVACDYRIQEAATTMPSQYFKIYDESVTLNESIQSNSSNTVTGVDWLSATGESTEPINPIYANKHKGLTMVAQWKWLQSFIPQVMNGEDWIVSNQGGSVTLVNMDPDVTSSDTQVNYFASTDERINVVAQANEGYFFVGWYDSNGNCVSNNPNLSYLETKEGVNTYYARFSNTITQTYIRQIQDQNGDWVEADDTVATLGRYSYTDVIGTSVSSTVNTKIGYKFLGWYDFQGRAVEQSMLSSDGYTIQYITRQNATYYARFEKVDPKPITIKKVDPDGKSIAGASVYLELVNGVDGIQNYGSSVNKTFSIPVNGLNLQLYPGIYKLKEVKAPQHYVAIDDVCQFTVVNNSSELTSIKNGDAFSILQEENTITITNKPDLSFTLQVKKDDGNQNPLEGVEFTLYKVWTTEDNGTKESLDTGVHGSVDVVKVQTLTTVLQEEQALVSFQKLEANNTYYLKETKAKSGYKLLEYPIEIQVTLTQPGQLESTVKGIQQTLENRILSITLSNYSIGEMPNTGITITSIKIQMFAFIIGCMTLLVLVILKMKYI
ncbi:MAG: SpaA isopeptide-forming pilin-related protein [Floccifex sp.]